MNKIRTFFGRYPRQYWLMFWGMLLSTSGASMIWPYLLIFVSSRLDMPKTAIASLITLNAISGVLSSFVAGPLADRLGRKWAMVFSLLADATIFLLMTRASTYLAFAILMVTRGLVNPFYRIGADAMLADLVPAGERQEAYALFRMINNAGISIGPVVGGILIGISYNLALYGAATGLSLYGLLLLFFARETLPPHAQTAGPAPSERWAGYDRVLRDGRFIPAIAAMAVGWMSAALMWIMLPVYANEQFGVPERLYGWIPATNAIMVVLLQLLVTRKSRLRHALAMMALGMAFYAIASLGVAYSYSFWMFWGCMVTMTVGELIIVPTSNAYVANSAPADMRARYMSVYALVWPFGSAFGPLLGGLLSDAIAPQATWFGGAAAAAVGTVVLFALFVRSQRITPAAPAAAGS